MGAKSGNGSIPGGWSPANAAIFTVLVTSIIWGGLFAVILGSYENKAATQFKQHRVEVNALNEQLGNYEKALRKKDISVVPILLKLRPQLDVAMATEISKAVLKYATQYRLPPEFVVHLMKRESGFNILAVSKAGAVGLMQILPKAHKDKMAKMGIDHSQLFHIDNNVRLGCWILRDYYDQTGSIEKALRKYVGGSNTSYTQDILIGYANETIPLKKLSKGKLFVLGVK